MMKKALITLLAASYVLSGCSAASGTSKTTGETSSAQVQETVKSSTAAQETANELEVVQADIIVIGAGGAGMMAAMQAHDDGAKVIILEKMPFAGGNTIRAKGGLNAAGTSVQKSLAIDDSADMFYEDTMKGGKELNDPEVVRYFADYSADAVEWLIDNGMDLSDVGQGAGSANPRMHRPMGGKSIGPILVKTLSENIDSRKIETYYNTTATELLVMDGKVIGVLAQDKDGTILTFESDAVIIATGGFAANEELFSKYRPDLKGFITTNHPGATGDGILMAETAGAALVDIDQIQTNPTVEQETTEVISETVRGLGAIFVNQAGSRFTNEMLTRDVLSSKILEQPEQYTYIIFDQNLRENMSAVEEMIALGIVTEGETIGTLATQIQMDASALEATIAMWNKAVAAKLDGEYQRDTGMDHDISKAPFYAIKVAPGVHHTMGGLKINDKTQVISTAGTVIPGLYAAGEVTGGVHGANRLGGNAVADIAIFGRQAGMQAAVLSLENGSLLVANDTPKAKEESMSVKEGLDGKLKDGTYTASTPNGRNGEITIEAIVKDGFVTKIISVSHQETDGIYDSVEKNLFADVIYNQTVDVDTVTGATVSSVAVLETLKDIFQQAK